MGVFHIKLNDDYATFKKQGLNPISICSLFAPLQLILDRYVKTTCLFAIHILVEPLVSQEYR